MTAVPEPTWVRRAPTRCVTGEDSASPRWKARICSIPGRAKNGGSGIAPRTGSSNTRAVYVATAR